MDNLANSHTLEEVERALKESDLRDAPAPKERNPNNGTDSVFALGKILRTIGSLAVIGAGAAFLIQQWNVLDDHVMRYLYFLGYTCLAALTGFFCAVKLKDDKGGRTLLALALALVPANFCQLGAITYSRVLNYLQEVSNLPRWAVLSADSDFAAIASLVAALILLTPIIYTAMSVLVREHALPATLAFIVANCALVIPVRDPDIIGFITLLLMAANLYVDRSLIRSNATMRTLEGGIVRALLVVPLLLLIGRTINLYTLSTLFTGAICWGIGIVIFESAKNIFASRRGAAFLQALSVFPFFLGWLLIAGDINLNEMFRIPVFTLPLAAILIMLSRRTLGSPSRYRSWAALIALGGAALQLASQPVLFSSLLCLGLSVATISYSAIKKERALLVLGSLGFMVGLLYQLRYAADLYDASPWATLGGLGLLLIVASSYAERNYRLIREKISTELESWS